MPYTALVTGASAGLGAELATQLARKGVDVVLVARSAERLELLAKTLSTAYGIHASALVADLTTEEGLEAVAGRLTERTRPIDILVNNAGFGIGAGFEVSDLADERRMFELLAWVPERLSHAAIPGMLQRGSGWILNVASVAAFTPTGTYGAAKAHVVSLSRSLNARYRRRGVHVCALCPGLINTEFHERMGVDHLPPLPGFVWAPLSRVADDGIRGVRAGRSVVVSNWFYRLLVPLNRLLPDAWQEQISTRSSQVGAER